MGAGPSPPGSMSCPGTGSWCQGRPEGFRGPLVSPQDRQVMSLLSGAGTLHCDAVFYLSPVVSHQTPLTESLHNSGESRSVWRKGVRHVRWLCQRWTGCTIPGAAGQEWPGQLHQDPPGQGPVSHVPCAECARRAPVYLCTPFSPPKAPYFSLTSQPCSPAPLL